MTSIVDKINKISSTIDKLFDFVANDETLSSEFEKYLEKNQIEVHTQAQIGDVLIGYLLDEKDVLDKYLEKNEVVEALKDSFCSVFEVKLAGKNSFEAYSLTNEMNFTLFPLVKMINLRTVCRGDFIAARVIKLGDEYFILEIFNVIGASRAHLAQRETVKCLVQSSKNAYWNNEIKQTQLRGSVCEFTEKFEDFFRKSVVTTTNRRVDELLEIFNTFCETGSRTDYAHLIEEPCEYRYFNLDDAQDDDFVASTLGGFSKHAETYDIALYCDKKYGIFLIPFYETVLRMNDKKALEELFEKYKKPDFSPTTVLYNSKTFSKMLGYKECKETAKSADTGRNEPCPCGSGNKYKKCCMVSI